MISSDLFATLRPGDKVRIVQYWPEDNSAGQNISGCMDKYLGSVMTIASCNSMCMYEPAVRMVEDLAWVWNRHAIAEVFGGYSLDLEEFI